MVRQGLRALLEQAGMAVIGEASDGQEALRVAHAQHPDVAVLDLTMPHLNGLETARRLRQALPQTKIVLLIAEGQTTKEIASGLGLRVKTVESHRINLMRRPDIYDTATRVRYVVRRGLTRP
jgi:DNA-binding NarL/FixJ family response regulator